MKKLFLILIVGLTIGLASCRNKGSVTNETTPLKDSVNVENVVQDTTLTLTDTTSVK